MPQLGRVAGRALWYLREVMGENAYERYLEHQRRRHPHQPVLSRRVFEREKGWQYRLASKAGGHSERGPSGSADMGHGQFGGASDAVWEIHRHPAGEPTRQRGDDDLVDLLPAGELADRVDGDGVDDLAIGLRAAFAKPGQLVLLAPLRQGPGNLVGAWDHHPLETTAEPPIGGLGLGHRGDEIEAALSGLHAFGELRRELVTAEGLVRHDEVPTHDLTPLGFLAWQHSSRP